MKRFITALALILLVPGAFVAGLGFSGTLKEVTKGQVASANQSGPGSAQFDPNNKSYDHQRYAQDFSLVWDVVDKMREVYYKPFEITDKTVHGAIRGMLRDSLEEPYTRFLDQKANEEMKVDTKGEFGGVGIYLGFLKMDEKDKDEWLGVIDTIPNTPAAKAGIKAKDLIVKIDDKPTDDMAMEQAVALIRGLKDTSVKITVFRRGNKGTLDFTLKRAQIVVPIMESKMSDKKNKVGYIRIRMFNEHTTEEFRKAYMELKKEGMKYLVFDLRNNPGGLLDQAVELSSQFLESGPVVHVEERGRRRISQMARVGQRIVDIPCVVLVNGASASASEIVSGAIQDNKVGVLMGSKTFGKGLVQTIFYTRNNTSVVITTARYLTSKGRDIDKAGIMPDELVSVTDEQFEADAKTGRDRYLERAEKFLLSGKANKFTLKASKNG